MSQTNESVKRLLDAVEVENPNLHNIILWEIAKLCGDGKDGLTVMSHNGQDYTATIELDDGQEVYGRGDDTEEAMIHVLCNLYESGPVHLERQERLTYTGRADRETKGDSE